MHFFPTLLVFSPAETSMATAFQTWRQWLGSPGQTNPILGSSLFSSVSATAPSLPHRNPSFSALYRRWPPPMPTETAYLICLCMTDMEALQLSWETAREDSAPWFHPPFRRMPTPLSWGISMEMELLTWP